MLDIWPTITINKVVTFLLFFIVFLFRFFILLYLKFQDRHTDFSDRERFPHGPRNLGLNIQSGLGDGILPSKAPGPAVAGPRSLRKRRSVRDARSADVGVSGIYEVVSEADLAFGPSREPVTVFSGRIREEVSDFVCFFL